MAHKLQPFSQTVALWYPEFRGSGGPRPESVVALELEEGAV
jgi:hypothetical protein